MDRKDLEAWVDRYEQLWRTAGTDRLGELFTDDVLYRAFPEQDTAHGMDALRPFWDAQRDGPDEEFTMRSEVVAIESSDASDSSDGSVGVVRARVDYGNGDSWWDIWVLRFAGDGRCEFFEEWPLAANSA